MANGFLTSAQVAHLLGVSAGTVKRWTRDGLLACARTAGGHRRFDPREVARLRAGGAARGATEGWLEVLLGPNDRAVDAALAAEHARAGAWWRVAEALGPVLDELGRRWQRGELDVVEEHRASERLGRALARAADGLRHAPGAPRVLLATAEGEEHVLGLALVELCLRELGLATIWVGRQTPAAALVRAVLPPRRRFEAVVLSASPCVSPAALAAQQAALSRACLDAGVALLVGGRGAWAEPVAPCRLERSFGGLRAWAAELAGGGWRGDAGGAHAS